MAAMKTPPLQGIRALELAEIWAGPFCGVLLGDMGAEIIKVEALQRMARGPIRPAPNTPGYPDYDPGERPWNRQGNFNATNRNKLGITLDLTQESGVDAFKELVAISDIVFTNYAFGVMNRLGLGQEILRAIKPDIIVLFTPGYGNTGPYRTHRSMGMAIDAMTGHSALRGYPDLDLSHNSLVHHPDAVAAVTATFAICAALHYRARTGKGQFIDLSQAEAFMPHMGEVFLENQMSGGRRERRGNGHPQMSPHGCYPCAGSDEWVTIAVRSEDEWRRLCEIIDAADGGISDGGAHDNGTLTGGASNDSGAHDSGEHANPTPNDSADGGANDNSGMSDGASHNDVHANPAHDNTPDDNPAHDNTPDDGMPALAADARFATLQGRITNRAALDAKIGAWTASRSRHAVSATLQAQGIPSAPVLNCGEDIYDDPHLQERQYFQLVSHPDAGIYPMSGPIWRTLSHTAPPPNSLTNSTQSDNTPPANSPSANTQDNDTPDGSAPVSAIDDAQRIPDRHEPAPCLGEHNEYLLRELLGCTADAYQAMQDASVIGTVPIEGADMGGVRRFARERQASAAS